MIKIITKQKILNEIIPMMKEFHGANDNKEQALEIKPV